MAKIINKNKNVKTKINDKQKLFCEEYLKDLNGSQAYLRAYGDVTEGTAKANASKLLAKANIKDYINQLIEAYSDSVDITVGEIVAQLKSIALDPEARNSDKIKALEILGKNKNMFVEKIEVTNKDIVVELE